MLYAFIRGLVFALALVVAGPAALAFDYGPYAAGSSSSDTFRLLDQPSSPQTALDAEPSPLPSAAPLPGTAVLPGTVAPPSNAALQPGRMIVTAQNINPSYISPNYANPNYVVPAYPNPTWAGPAPTAGYVPAMSYVPPSDGSCQTPLTQSPNESSWYTRIDYFHWNERVNGADFTDEDGALWTLGYERRVGRERFRAELFGSQVHYDANIYFGPGDIEPLSSVTNYLGVRGEYEYLFEPETLPELSFFVGIGTRFWIRDLPDAYTTQGSFVWGYQETWWTIYPYLGLETKHNPQAAIEWYCRSRIGLTAVTYEYANVYPPITLFPRPGVTGQLEAGLRGQRLFVGAYLEAMSWSQSAIVRGWLQPTSTMLTAGLQTGVSF
jgi:hypothetical protein